MLNLLKNLAPGDKFYSLADPYEITWTVKSHPNEHVVLCRDSFGNEEVFDKDKIVRVIAYNV